jgi:hypothetical protein
MLTRTTAAAAAAAMCASLQGAGVFLAGNLLQFVSHRQLAGLASGSKPGSEETTYKIPTGEQQMPIYSCVMHAPDGHNADMICFICHIDSWQA